jgi:hypothetical protein
VQKQTESRHPMAEITNALVMRKRIELGLPAQPPLPTTG